MQVPQKQFNLIYPKHMYFFPYGKNTYSFCVCVCLIVYMNCFLWWKTGCVFFGASFRDVPFLLHNTQHAVSHQTENPPIMGGFFIFQKHESLWDRKNCLECTKRTEGLPEGVHWYAEQLVLFITKKPPILKWTPFSSYWVVFCVSYYFYIPKIRFRRIGLVHKVPQ